jgi:hypothetical protein
MKLKPCPKCGSGELYQREQTSDNVAFISPIFVVECATCRCIVYGYTVEKAIEAWNHRPLEDALKAHAVEVLAKELRLSAEDVGYVEDESFYIKEARALLGWEE